MLQARMTLAVHASAKGYGSQGGVWFSRAPAEENRTSPNNEMRQLFNHITSSICFASYSSFCFAIFSSSLTYSFKYFSAFLGLHPKAP